MQKTVVKIVDLFGKELPIEKMEFLFVGDNWATGNYKGFGFMKTYNQANGYTVITR